MHVVTIALIARLGCENEGEALFHHEQIAQTVSQFCAEQKEGA